MDKQKKELLEEIWYVIRRNADSDKYLLELLTKAVVLEKVLHKYGIK